MTGIPLGDGCSVDAGIAILAGTKFSVSANQLAKINEANPSTTLEGASFKGKELAGLNGLHFRQDSTTGALVVLRSTREVKLNADLH